MRVAGEAEESIAGDCLAARSSLDSLEYRADARLGQTVFFSPVRVVKLCVETERLEGVRGDIDRRLD